MRGVPIFSDCGRHRGGILLISKFFVKRMGVYKSENFSRLKKWGDMNYMIQLIDLQQYLFLRVPVKNSSNDIMTVDTTVYRKM